MARCPFLPALGAGALSAVLTGGCAHHIPDPGPMSFAPLPTPTASPAVCWVEFATGVLPHALTVAHGAMPDDTASTQSGLLIVHPQGTWLIDGGMATDNAAQMAELHGLTGLVVRKSAATWVREHTPAEALHLLGADALTGSVPTHAHYDHLGGLLELPDVPIWLPAGEIEFAAHTLLGRRADVFPAHARALPSRAKAIPFAARKVAFWDEAWDIFGDSSVLIVPTPGHTPGSVTTFVHLADGRWIADVGDSVWVREGYEQREPKSWIAKRFDNDGAGTDAQIQRLWALHQQDPSIVLLPAHDRRQWIATFGSPGACVR